MGKRLNTNPKALEARERKEALKKEKNETIERKKADEYWRDDDKHINKKIDRQREKEMKAQEERTRKAALKAEYEKEMEAAEQSAKSKASKLAAEVQKVSRSTIQTKISEMNTASQITKQMSKININPSPLIPNLNRIEPDGENASTVDQALDIFKQSTVKDLQVSSKRR